MPMNTETHGATVAIETLGCKVNQYETSYLLESLNEAGYTCVTFRGPADIYIVHSCAVTAKAGFQARQLLRRAHRTNPNALIVVAGCYAQLDADRIAREKLATHILGNPAKFDLVTWLRRPGSFSQPCRATGNDSSSCPGIVEKPGVDPGDFEFIPVTAMHTGRTRAILKIQDGCNSFCSYCVVPLVRGRARSLLRVEVLAQMERLVDAGYPEIVLTGIHLGQWGKDLPDGQNLGGLLEAIGVARHPARLRLSSLEPMEIDSELLGLISSLPWICPHLHVPLQSGDAEILTRMRRPYSPQKYSELVLRIKDLLPDAAIGADVLVGFPGEAEKHFENTLRLIEELPLSYLHVFPFSPRPGTPASKYSDQVQGREAKRRAHILQELGRRKKRDFRSSFIGKRLDVLIQTRSDSEPWEGLSGNYINVAVHSNRELRPGQLVSVAIDGFRGDDLEGRVVP